MLTLIKREIADNLIYFIGAAAVSAVIVFLLIMATYYQNTESSEEMILPKLAAPLSIPAIFLSIIGICAMGSSQMYTDKNRGISALLTTLPVTRPQILLARISAGLLAILILLVPITVAAAFAAAMLAPPLILPAMTAMLFKVSICIFLLALACYCIGLQTGWTSNKVTPTLGALVLTLILVPIFVIKGLSTHTIVILTIFIVASIIRTWVKFMSTPL